MDELAPAGGSMVARLKRLTPESMGQAQRELYRTLTTGPRSKDPAFPLINPDGSLQGPFAALLLSPVIGAALQEVGNSLRRTSELSPREREITIIMVASHWDCEFELDTHERIGREVDLSEKELQLLRQGTVPNFADQRETSCALLAQALVRAPSDVSGRDWEAWVQDIGDIGVFELSSIVGYYSTLALQIKIFCET